MDLAHDVCDSPLDISWSSNAGAEYHVKEDHTADGQLYFGCHDLPNISPVRSDVLWHSSVRHKHVLKESARCLEYRDIEDNCSQTYCLSNDGPYFISDYYYSDLVHLEVTSIYVSNDDLFSERLCQHIKNSDCGQQAGGGGSLRWWSREVRDKLREAIKVEKIRN